MGDFNRDWAYARAHPECPFEGDPIEFDRGLTGVTAELELGDREPLTDTSHQR